MTSSNLRLEDNLNIIDLLCDLFLKANEDLKLIPDIQSSEMMMDIPAEEKIKLRDHFLKHPELIDAYLEENSSSMSPEDVETVEAWRKHFIKDRFHVVRHLKNYSVYLKWGENPKAYGVISPGLPIDRQIWPVLPVMIEAVLLPYKGRIINDGLTQTWNVYFGPGIRKGIEDDYRKARSLSGIITSLPHEEVEPTDEERLKAYLKTLRDRDQNWDEIHELLHRNLGLLPVYHQEMGRLDSRSLKKRLKDMGVKKGWFGVLVGLIVASGTSREELEDNLRRIIPKERQSHVYIFSIR